ncbi:EF-hand superfamily Ca2+-modulated protein [Pleomassaria siparia CBS 279.74]|uniref:EF-hand superfamily Ca2+-modulated protein n=1 Tax=Pleomassaria siparia CBS 279.74 TaxID=1314801 RepID=A0A6G1JTA4_9PLEO|nr:EF-hand superfamily Ca2+-modulated protein [Pleomassaria siparia CBS 279.74]
MPPKRRAPTVVAQRPSKLAKEHGLTADQEAEIREAYGLFAIQHPDYKDSEEGVLRRDDVRRCLMYDSHPLLSNHTLSLNLIPEKSVVPSILSTLDPFNAGFVEFNPFISYAAIAIHTKDDVDDEDYDDQEEFQGEANAQEVRAAYTLFTHGGTGPITLAHLRRVAKELREDVSDDILKDMIREANGGVKGKGKDTGSVGLEDFEAVMKRAGLAFR